MERRWWGVSVRFPTGQSEPLDNEDTCRREKPATTIEEYDVL